MRCQDWISQITALTSTPRPSSGRCSLSSSALCSIPRAVLHSYSPPRVVPVAPKKLIPNTQI
jgi:hypothetical protein